MAPRLSNTRKPSEAPASIGDNSLAVEEANRVQFLSLVAKLTEAEAEIEVARAPLKAAQGRRKQVIGMAKAAGVPEWQLKARQEELGRNTSENAANVEQETKQRRWLGIITPEQMTMFRGSETPQEIRDEESAKTEGFKRGVRGLSAELPDGLHARLTQPFLTGHAAGRQDYLLTLAENVPKPKGTTAQEVAEKAAADFVADEPEPGHYEAQRAEREAIRKAKAALDGMQPSDEGDGFEASPEELAAQTLRPSVQENEGEVVV